VPYLRNFGATGCLHGLREGTSAFSDNVYQDSIWFVPIPSYWFVDLPGVAT